MLVSKSAGKQMKQSKNGYKPSKIVQKIFADLFVNSSAIRRLTASFFTPADSLPQSLVTVILPAGEGHDCSIALGLIPGKPTPDVFQFIAAPGHNQGAALIFSKF